MSRRITAGNDAPFRWAVKLQGKPFDLSGKDVKVYVINSRGEIPVARLTIEGHEVSGVFEGRYQTRLGEHSLVLRVNEGRPEMKTATVANVFELVQWSADAGGSDEGDVIVAPVLIESELSIGGGSYDDRELREAIADLEETKVDDPVVIYTEKLGNPVYSDKDGTGWSTQQVENAFGMTFASFYEDVKKRGVVYDNGTLSLYAFQSIEQDGQLTYCFNVSTADSKTKNELWLAVCETPETVDDIEVAIIASELLVHLSYDDTEVKAELARLEGEKAEKPFIFSAEKLGDPTYQKEEDGQSIAAFTKEQVEAAFGMSTAEIYEELKTRDALLDLGIKALPCTRYDTAMDGLIMFYYYWPTYGQGSAEYHLSFYAEPAEIAEGVEANLVIRGTLADYIGIKEELTELSAEVSKKQDTITDLETIRSGAAKGATALQSVPDEYATKQYVDNAISEIPAPTPSASNEWKCVFDGRMEVGTRKIECSTYADGTPLKAEEMIVQVLIDENSTTATQGYVTIHSTNNQTDSLYGALYFEKSGTDGTPQFCEVKFKASPMFMVAEMCESIKPVVAQGGSRMVRLGNKIPPQIYEDITYVKVAPNGAIQGAAPLVKIYAR